ncbi:MAG: hypothetical protein ABSE89_12195 [Sedimentisphaerales bacterium]
MKTKLNLIAFYLLVLTIGGCVPVLSINPLFGENDTVLFDPNLLGFWKVADSNQTWLFSRSEEPNIYELVITENDGKQGNFFAGLGELEDNLFLVIYPKESESKESDFFKLHTRRLFSSMRIELTDPNLEIAMMDMDKVDKIIKADPNILKYELVDNIITSPTEGLQAFVIKYGIEIDDANSIFSEPAKFTRVAEEVD